jgi:COP9 signalosome complex subunit 5
MVMHARSGGELEVMGLMQGYVDADTFVVTDAFGLPVEGTETRVNAQDEANEYIVEYLRLSREQGREENAVGWYHSHPGYGCWLSGIDVETEHVQQSFSDPFVAVVIDPDRTISAGRVEIGAFRTFPKDYKDPESSTESKEGSSTGGRSVPLAKAEDFGAHASRYYSLEVSHFKSTLDTSLLELLWNKYWVQTLSQSPLFTNRDYGNKQMLDLGYKIREANTLLQRHNKLGHAFQVNKKLNDELEKLARDSQAVIGKEIQGLVATEVKANIFNGLGGAASPEVEQGTLQ